MIRLVHWKRHGQEWPLGPFITELRKKISNAGVKKKVFPFMGRVLNGFLPLPPEMGKRERGEINSHVRERLSHGHLSQKAAWEHA